MLKLFNISAERDERQLFKGLSLSLGRGECLYVVGPNGAGKTTLLRIICGLTSPSTGRIAWDGDCVDQFRERYCADLLYLGHRNANKAELSCLENLRISMGLEGVSMSDDALEDALGDAGLGALAHLPARFLSQGQQRRLAMARLSVSPAKIWVLDEPYSALDASAIDWLDQKIDHHLTHQGVVVLTSHQPLAIKGYIQELDLKAWSSYG